MKKNIIIALTMAMTLSFTSQAFAHDYAMSYLFGGTTVQYDNYIKNTNGVLNSVSPDYFEINTDGTLNDTKADMTFISDMKNSNLKVIPFVTRACLKTKYCTKRINHGIF